MTLSDGDRTGIGATGFYDLGNPPEEQGHYQQ